jgi:hypothetical protein
LIYFPLKFAQNSLRAKAKKAKKFMLSESEAKATLFENPKRKRSESERISKILSESEAKAKISLRFASLFA